MDPLGKVNNNLPLKFQNLNSKFSNRHQKIYFWENETFVGIAILMFWPIGVFLMWKYTYWSKLIKWLISLFYSAITLILLFWWGLYFGAKTYESADRVFNPKVLNYSENYICEMVDEEWSRCSNSEYKFSFEYPANWYYVDLKPDGIGFGPLKENLADNYIFSWGSPYMWKSEDDAKEFALHVIEKAGEKTEIDGLFSTKKISRFLGGGLNLETVIVDGRITYQLSILLPKTKRNSVVLTDQELIEIFEHMSNSFRKLN